MLVSVPKIAAVRLELLRREVNAGRRFLHGFLNLRTHIVFYICMASQRLTISQVGHTFEIFGRGNVPWSCMAFAGVVL